MLNDKGRLTFQPFNKNFSPYLNKNLRMSVIVHENVQKHLAHYHLLELGDQFGIWREAFEGGKCIEIFLATKKKDCI